MLNIVLVEPEIPQNCGNIARTCAATGSRLHLVRPLGFDISEKAVRRAGLDYWHLVDVSDYENLEELFRQSDIISLHCPLTEETHHMINDEAVEMMKPGVVIVNTSRGGLIDTESLINGIKVGIVGAACLDVYEEEGDVFYEDLSGHVLHDDKLVRLISMPNVIVTSHQAFLTREALDNIASTTVSNLTRFFAGNPDETTEVL